MPRMRSEYSGNPDAPFEKAIGLSLVACRIVDRQEGLLSVEIPAIPEPDTIIILSTGIARSRGQR